MKKQNLTSKLRDYSLAAGVIFLTKSEAEGQIVFHHYNPPLVIGSNESLDLNNDGLFDLDFSIFAFVNSNGGYEYSNQVYSWSATVVLNATNNCAIAMLSYDLQKLNPGQTVNSSLSWCECPALLAHEYKNYDPWIHTSSGNWLGQTNGYFGFRLKVGLDKYYGWMRMSVSPWYVTIHEYAYDSVANAPIFVGETGCDWLNATVESIPGDTVCNGDMIELKASPNAGFNFVWRKVGGILNNATDSIYQVASGTDDYFVIVSVPNNCYDTSAVVHVAHINPVSASVYIVNDILYSSLPNIVQWYFNGYPIPGATDYFCVPVNTGSYQVITYSGDCYATSSPYYFLATNSPVIENLPFPKISLEEYNLVIEVSPDENRSRMFSISDMLGRKHLQMTSSNSSLTIGIHELPAGEYILVIQDERSQTTFRFLKT